MAIPTLTPTQEFQNSINQIPVVLARLLDINNPQGGITSTYVRLYNTIFQNINGTSTDAITNLGTGAANIFGILTGIYTFLEGQAISGILPLPAYTANADGTVTLN